MFWSTNVKNDYLNILYVFMALNKIKLFGNCYVLGLWVDFSQQKIPSTFPENKQIMS